MMKTATLAVLLLVVCGSAAVAGIPPEPWVEVEQRADQPVSLFCTPSGGGVPFADADAFGGWSVDATLVIVLYDDQPGWGTPVAGYPAEDMWLMAFPETLLPCPGGTIPDANTDADGRTYWSSPLRTGGVLDPDAGTRLEIWVNGMTAYGLPDLEMRLNSADHNGDLRVNLTDVGLFATDLFGAYAYRSDFVWDGVINISDAGRMAGAIGSACP